MTPDTTYLSSPGNTVKFNEEIQCIRDEIEKLKRKRVDIIIGLGHSGWTKDVEIAQMLPDIDVIVGGHTHTFLYSGKPPSFEVPKEEYPIVINHGSHQSLVVQAYAYGKYLGLIDIEFDKKGNIQAFEGKPILLDESMPEGLLIPLFLISIEQSIVKQIPKSQKKSRNMRRKCRLNLNKFLDRL